MGSVENSSFMGAETTPWGVGGDPTMATWLVCYVWAGGALVSAILLWWRVKPRIKGLWRWSILACLFIAISAGAAGAYHMTLPTMDVGTSRLINTASVGAMMASTGFLMMAGIY